MKLDFPCPGSSQSGIHFNGRNNVRKIQSALQYVAGIACLLVLSLGANALALPSIFGDHMVLQQGKDIQVWGWADPGETVNVKLGDAEESATANDAGDWRVSFEPRATGDTLVLEVTNEKDTLVFEDVLLGEVWLCSGQSNMQWPLSSANNATLEIANADYPEMRLFSVTRTVAEAPQKDCEGTWMVCTPESAGGFSAVGYFFGRELHQALGQPVGVINTSWGGTPAESWTTHESLMADPILTPMVERWNADDAAYHEAKAAYDTALADWKVAEEKAKVEGVDPPEKPAVPTNNARDSWRPAGLYNAMIAPLVPFGIQGAIWYQGESNAGRAWQYRTLFPRMIKDWHAAWNQGAFPFLFVQLANYTARVDEPGDSDWAELREAQNMTLDAVENSGQAVIIDIGMADDIHPKNKQEVGRRLALIARAKTYGEDVVPSGPVYKSMNVNEKEVTLTFDHADLGLQAYDQGKLVGFAVAGEDKKFVWANAKIDGDKVIVSSEEVAAPVAVRYGWANNPFCNLHNGVGLPASPFRTDDWPGVTVDAR